MEATTSTFLITHADDDSAMARDVHSGQVHPLADNPGVEAGDVIEATVAPEPPLELTWQVIEVDDRRTIPVKRSEEPPTSQERELASEQEIGEMTRTERAGTGEIHVISVDPAQTDAAVADVLEDEGTRTRGARLGVNRVEIRADGTDGIISVRYLP
ncbi:DUF5812 family protein [Halocatena halophila]|uniref:DUF5812 family protein n=1 Tax=Halocatena halophila TaxID=2814576 RepID=UPI002ED1FE59